VCRTCGTAWKDDKAVPKKSVLSWLVDNYDRFHVTQIHRISRWYFRG